MIRFHFLQYIISPKPMVTLFFAFYQMCRFSYGDTFGDGWGGNSECARELN